MGIDYDGVGGVGIKIEKNIVEMLVKGGSFSIEEWEDDPYTCVENLKISYSMAGDYDLPKHFYLWVDGDNFQELIENAPKFVKKLEKLGVVIGYQDIKIISDILIS